MAAHSQPKMLALRLRVPRGYEDFWRLIRARDEAQGTFTTAEISAETNVQRQSVEHYVARLVAGGYAELAERRRYPGRPCVNVYRLIKKPKAAPRLRPDGTKVGEPAQQRLWNSIRGLKQFTTEELAWQAAGDDGPVPKKTAQRYINQLARAGYLTCRGASRRHQQYMLKPGMNTGPLSPSVMVTEFVFDRNLGRVIGDEQQATEVAS